MSKPKTFYDTLKSIRLSWTMNPITRIQDNEKKNKKKLRAEGKKIARSF